MKRSHLFYFTNKCKQFELIVPREYAGDFIAEFGVKFSHRDEVSGQTMVRKVENYFISGGWHIIVLVYKGEEDKFEKFITDFFKIRGIELEE